MQPQKRTYNYFITCTKQMNASRIFSQFDEYTEMVNRNEHIEYSHITTLLLHSNHRDRICITEHIYYTSYTSSEVLYKPGNSVELNYCWITVLRIIIFVVQDQACFNQIQT